MAMNIQGGTVMCYERSEVQEKLRRIVQALAADSAWHEDLVQEATIHLWLMEGERPNQTQSWYLQSCQFHLLNYLRSGCSVDATRRRRERVPFPAEDAEEAAFQLWFSDGAAVSEVSAQEIVGLLEGWLTPSEIPVLRGLAGGFGVREIARQIGISHQAVSKHRGKIARLAVELGIGFDLDAPINASPRQIRFDNVALQRIPLRHGGTSSRTNRWRQWHTSKKLP